ncbi:MAG: cytochrome b [Sedimenticola sp.]|nr:cytochrome b [Sedimenticola sp.]
MNLRNSDKQFGLVSIFIHWIMALLIIGLFALGLYMTGLDYYDPWYKTAPDIHRSLGVIMLLLLVFRLVWRLGNPVPAPVDNDPEILHKLAEWVHRLLYLLLFFIALSGYLISTADGRGIDVFNWFTVPALVPSFENMEDLAGEVHFVLAVTLIAMASLHGLAALKHHFIDRDLTLLRMLGRTRSLDH